MIDLLFAAKRPPRALLCSAAFALFSFSFSAHASDISYPNLSGQLSIEIENDRTYQSDDAEAELNDLYPILVLDAQIEVTHALSVNLEATLEPVSDANANRAFEDVGGYVNILTANYETEEYSVYFGKFTPNFGIAWSATPGHFGTDINDDYNFSEMLGAGGALNFNHAGQHTISASMFFADTTVLSDSAGSRRGRLRKSDGGPGNTESLASYALALDGAFNGLNDLHYHVGFSSLAEGNDGETRQLGFVVGGDYEYALSDTVTASPIAEYAFINNNGGVKGDTAQYLTGGLHLDYENWFGSVTYQRRETGSSGDHSQDYVGAVTLGYGFESGLELSVGWTVNEEDDIQSKTLGALIAYSIGF